MVEDILPGTYIPGYFISPFTGFFVTFYTKNLYYFFGAFPACCGDAAWGIASQLPHNCPAAIKIYCFRMGTSVKSGKTLSRIF